MAFAPYENIILESDLSYNEILNRIQKIIEPKRFIFSRLFKKNNGKTYEGELFENKFKMRRIILYTNSFIPIIYGTIITESNKTKIYIRMKLHIFVKIFMCLWFGFFISFFLPDIRLFISNMELNVFPLTPVIVILFGYIFMIGSFKAESRKSKIYLGELFEAKIKKLDKGANCT
jgi:hypothetical protein